VSDAPKQRRPGARIRTLVYGLYVAFAAAFVLLCVKEIVVGVFGLREGSVATAPPGSPGRACADGIRDLMHALDRGVLAANAARDEKEAVTRLDAALAPEWDREAAVATNCSMDPNGSEAWAALLRLRRAEEGAAGRRAVLVGPMRADVARLAGGPP
jgi:hypothetical protein